MNLSGIVTKITPSIAKIYCLNEHNLVVGTGSSFLYWQKGLLVTCNHLVEKSHSLVCKFSDEADKLHPIKVALRDPEHDLALLKIETEREPLAHLTAESGKNIRPGMPVLFSGYPLSLETLTTHQGILSAITVDAVGVTTYLIDGTVNAGNSGCPLMNVKGEILGVVNAKRRERSALLSKVEEMSLGAISLHGIDLVEIYQALISNVQLGIGYAVPASYIPEHKEAPNPVAEPRINAKVKTKSKGQPSKRKTPRRGKKS